MRYSTISGVVRWSGGTSVLSEGMAADDDHALVVERPDLWTDEAPQAKLRGPSAGQQLAVERATNRPGTRRGGVQR
jgi:hypothetical protein